MNVGEFWAVVILQTLPILGLIPAEFITCSCLARDSGAASFLLREYDLVLKDDTLLDLLSERPFFKNPMGRPMAENTICELKRHRDAKVDNSTDTNGSRYCEFWRTDGRAFFAKEADHGHMRVIYHNGDIKTVKLTIVAPDDKPLQSSQERKGELTMVVSNGSLDARQNRSNWWWTNCLLKPGKNGKLNLDDVPRLVAKRDRLNFSRYIECYAQCGEGLFEFTKGTTATESRRSAKQRRKKRTHTLHKIAETPQIQKMKDKRSEPWCSNPHIDDQSNNEKKKRQRREVMKQLLYLVDLSEVDCIDASAVAHSSLVDITEKLVSYAQEDDSWVDDDIVELLARCDVVMNRNNPDESKQDWKTDLDSLLNRITNKCAQTRSDETFVPKKGIDTRHTMFVKRYKLNILRYEGFINVEKNDRTAMVSMDIDSIAMMVDPLVRCTNEFKTRWLALNRVNYMPFLQHEDLHFNFEEKIWRDGSGEPITLYSCHIHDRDGVKVTSADKLFYNKAETNVKKRLMTKGTVGFSIGAVPSEPGYYFTREYAKLAVLASYVMNKLGPANGASLWEELFPRPISIVYPTDDNWNDSIAAEMADGMRKLPIIAVVRHPKGTIFVDLHQLAFIDLDDNETHALRIAHDINYCTTKLSLRDVRANILRDHCCIMVGLCSSDMKSVSNFPSDRVSSTKYHYGDDVIPDGTMTVKVDRIKGTGSDCYYILPKTNVKLRSREECVKYKECLDRVDGNEHLALADFWNIRDRYQKRDCTL